MISDEVVPVEEDVDVEDVVVYVEFACYSSSGSGAFSATILIESLVNLFLIVVDRFISQI